MKNAGVDVDEYCAYEIDRYAVDVAKHNFPEIKELGDVFDADFSIHEGVDFLIGGSPCTYWSIAQKPDRREKVASGIGWELFSQYVRALREAKPKMFIYENNKSMNDAIRSSISETFGFEPVYINSSLVSAQDRKRLYWVGIRNEDGTYRQVDVETPHDRNIMLRDILDFKIATNDDYERMRVRQATSSGFVKIEAGNCVDLLYERSRTRRGRDMHDKSNCLQTKNEFYQYVGMVDKSAPAYPIKVFIFPRKDGVQTQGQAFRVYSQDAKAVCLKSNVGGSGAKTGLYAIDNYEDGCETYEVRNGRIEVNGRQYPIKIRDGTYCIRKLTIDECKRLQTVPEWYDLSCVSETQAYKLLGNGWTCDVITHLINSCMKECNG